MNDDDVCSGEEPAEPESHAIDRFIEEFQEFVDEFKGETDRAAAILGAAKLDQQLRMVLEQYLAPHSGSDDELFSHNGPLGSFSAKIGFCFRLRLIDDAFCRALHLTRKIRNDFAHEVYGASLNSGSHRDRIRSLVTPIRESGGFKFLKVAYFKETDDARADFSTMLGLMIVRLDGLIERLPSITQEHTQHLDPVWKANEDDDET